MGERSRLLRKNNNFIYIYIIGALNRRKDADMRKRVTSYYRTIPTYELGKRAAFVSEVLFVEGTNTSCSPRHCCFPYASREFLELRRQRQS